MELRALMITGLYTPRFHQKSKLYGILSDYYDDFYRVYDKRYREKYGPFRKVVKKTVQKILHCANPEDGFAHLRCRGCGRENSVPCLLILSLTICASCQAIRKLLQG